MHVHGKIFKKFVYVHGKYAIITIFAETIIRQKDMAQERKVTILDIASYTGLSKGTIDRVLHNRGEVSKKSYEKVMSAIKEMGYEPDLNASILARKEAERIALLMPEKEKGTFWELALSGLEEVKEHFLPMRIRIDQYSYDQYSEESFCDTCSRLLEDKPAGVVIVPIFQAATITFCQELNEAGIPYCFIDSKLDSENYLAYFGMPMYKSGYLCADQLTCGAKVDDVLIVRVHRDKGRQSDPTVNRRAGFMDYMLQKYPSCNIHSRFIDSTDKDMTMATMEAFFREHPSVKHIAMFNSRIHLLVPFLEKYPDPERRVVAFDNLNANMAALRHGTISVLIGQHPEKQVFNAIQTMSDFILLGRRPQRTDNYMHMDILTPFNLENY